MLMFTFSSAANSVMVAELGGSKSFMGDVVVLEEAGTSLPENSLSPGQSVDYGYLVEDIEWNYNDNVRLSHVEVIVVWESNGNPSLTVGSRSVTLDASTQNGNTSDSEPNAGFGDTITIQLVFNMLPETVSGMADTPEDLVESYEREGEWVGGTFTYDSGSTVTDDNSINYTISLKVYTWDIQNIREINEV
jgi:hypothetical protein